MSSSKDTTCGLNTANILEGRTRSQSRKALINSVLKEVHPFLANVLRRELTDDSPYWDEFRTHLDTQPNSGRERWVRRESDAEGYWEEQMNPNVPTFGDCRYIEFSVEL